MDGELGHETRERVLAHLATCARCKAEADAQRALKNVFAEAAPPPPSASFLARLQGLPGGGDLDGGGTPSPGGGLLGDGPASGPSGSSRILRDLRRETRRAPPVRVRPRPCARHRPGPPGGLRGPRLPHPSRRPPGRRPLRLARTAVRVRRRRRGVAGRGRPRRRDHRPPRRPDLRPVAAPAPAAM
ncbi:zf-HC2 domain-containing protein [Streptomyces tricolor]|nr:zf-HC2 domain-containing protein [Streptomyces tricolor]